MNLKFGTSGLRGLVSEMDTETVARYTRAFLAACDCGGGLYIGRDLRPSSLRIAEDVMAAAREQGRRVVDCGALPTPALALAAQQAGYGAVMVTGSHIPADRNGLKFYTLHGEITKKDEAGILARLDLPLCSKKKVSVNLETDNKAPQQFIDRYVEAFGPHALAGRRIGSYAHSAVGRDVLAQILTALGAQVIELGRSDSFIPVDTEAVDPDTRARIKEWVKTHVLDALVSMDGDSDRPLLADETGQIVPGDILGQITAETLGAQVVVTPISSNSGVMLKGFHKVIRTRIGSPFVIAGMEGAGGRVAGFEANGGFLLGFEARGPAGPIAPLMTRDCVLPLVAGLYAARGGTLSARVAQEPPIVTLADRLQNIPQERSNPFLARLAKDVDARAAFLALFGQTEQALDLTDGLRMTLQAGKTVHIRPSGNAPELRLYIEAPSAEAAHPLLHAVLGHLRDVLASDP